MPQPVRVGTRASQLALTQTGHVADALTSLGAGPCELVHVRTDGDRLTGSLTSMGGTGVFVTALRDALLEGRCDVAVHSFKDLPTAPADGLVVAAVPPREDPRDVLCARGGARLADLPAGARVGTGSPRRAAQLLAARPDLQVVDIRGNVDTRLARALGPEADLDAVVLARAGLSRLGRLDVVSEALAVDVVTPAPAQGALAVEVRAADADADHPLARALAGLDDPASRVAALAERALLARLEAGCAAPVGAHATVSADGTTLELSAVALRPDGGARVARTGSAPISARDGRADPADPADRTGPADADDLATAVALGREVAEALLSGGAAALAGLDA